MELEIKQLSEDLEDATEQFCEDILGMECIIMVRKEKNLAFDLFTDELLDSFQKRTMDYLEQHAEEVWVVIQQIVRHYRR